MLCCGKQQKLENDSRQQGSANRQGTGGGGGDRVGESIHLNPAPRFLAAARRTEGLLVCIGEVVFHFHL